jgi:hypothetical protein
VNVVEGGRPVEPRVKKVKEGLSSSQGVAVCCCARERSASGEVVVGAAVEIWVAL